MSIATATVTAADPEFTEIVINGNVYTVKAKFAAKIGGTGYATIADAIAAVEASDGQYTLADIEVLDPTAEIPDTVYLDGDKLVYKPVATIQSAKQRWPWNGKVDVTVKAEKLRTDKSYALKFKLLDISDDNTSTNVYTYATGVVIADCTEKSGVKATVDMKSESEEKTTPDKKVFKKALLVPVLVEGPAETYVQLWKDGPYWAKCNLGATKPEEYGYYYWWGDTVGYKRNAADNGWVCSTNDQATIQFSPTLAPANTTYGKTIDQLKEAGYIDASNNLNADHDAAAVALKAPWRMPTLDELQALVDNCTSVWTDNYNNTGVAGRIVTGKTEGYTDRSIFLPAAGYGNKSSLSRLGSHGYYWSSTPNSGNSDYAWYLNFSSGYFSRYNNFYRNLGQSVRPVRGFAQ